MNSRHTKFERQLWRAGADRVAGLDEAGRGPLAGPVVAAAVIMPKGVMIREVDDSKVLSEEEREDLFERIHQAALGVGVGIVDHLTIDRINILQASFLAMELALRELNPAPDHLLIDGNRFQFPARSELVAIPYTLLVDGDARSFSIACASVIAKVTRDRIMTEYDALFPLYAFAKNKGYSTPEHREAIFRFGWCDIHRRSFTVKQQLELPFEHEPTVV